MLVPASCATTLRRTTSFFSNKPKFRAELSLNRKVFHHMLPTWMLGFNKGSRFGSDSAEARPSLAIMIMRVKNPITPTNKNMNIRCVNVRAFFLGPVRFLRTCANQLRAGRLRYLSSSKSICITEAWPESRVSYTLLGEVAVLMVTVSGVDVVLMLMAE